jgi:hypothetical protein
VAANLHGVYFLSCPFDIIIITDNAAFVNRFLKIFLEKNEGLSPFILPIAASRPPPVQPLCNHQQNRAHTSRPHNPRLTAEQSQTETKEGNHATHTGEKKIDRMHHSSYFLSCLRFKPS